MDHDERIEVKCEEVQAWEDALFAARDVVRAYEELLRKAEWELHTMLKLPDTITDVFDDDD